MTDTVYRDYDQAALDRQYDNRGLVPGFQSFLDRYAADSAAARSALQARLDVPYGAGEAETLDIFTPADAAGPAPIQVFFHGGYWKALSKAEFSYVAGPVTAAGGIAVVVDYGLIPTVDMDALVGQCRAAVAWVYRNAAAFGGDPTRLFVSGHSAGGHLAAMVAATEWHGRYGLPRRVVAGAVAISGLFDLEPIRLSFLNRDLRLTPDQVWRNSPVNLPPPPPPMPVAIAFGADESDEYAWQSATYAGYLATRALTPEIRPILGRHHFSIAADLGDPDSELCRLVLDQMGIAAGG